MSSSTGSAVVRSLLLCIFALLGVGALSPGATMAQPIPELAYDGVPVIVEHDHSMLANAGFFEAVINPTSTRGYQTIFSKDGNGYITGGHINLEMRNGKLVARIQSTSQSFRVDSGALRVPVNVDSLVRLRFGPEGFVLFVDDVVVGRNNYVGGLGVTSDGTGNQQALVIGANNGTSRDGGFDPLRQPFVGHISDVHASFLEPLDDASPRFALSVVDGISSPAGNPEGMYRPGDMMAVRADTPPPGEVFAGWSAPSAVTLADPSSATTTFVMPSTDITIEAVFDNVVLTNVAYRGTPIVIPNESTVPVNAGHVEVTINPTTNRGTQGIFSKDGSGYIDGGHITLEMHNGLLKGRLQSTDQTFKIDSGEFRAPANAETTVRLDFGPGGFVMTVNGEEMDRETGYAGGLGTTSGGSGNAQAFVFGAKNTSSRDGGLSPLKNPFRGTIRLVSTNVIEDPDNPTPRFGLSVNDGSAHPPGPLLAGDVAEIRADDPAPGNVFSHWSMSGGVSVANPTAAITTLTMPAAPARVEASHAPFSLANLMYQGVPIRIPNEHTVPVNAGHFEVAIAPTSIRGRQGIFAKDGNGYITGGHLLLEMKWGKLFARLQSARKTYRVDSGAFRVPNKETTLVRVEFGPGGFALFVNNEEVDREPGYEGGLGASSGGIGNEQILVIGSNNNTSRDGGLSPLRDPFKGTIEVVSTNIIEDPNHTSPRFELSVVGGTASPSGEVRAGELVILEADAPDIGNVFTGWSAPDGTAIGDAGAPLTTLVMPASDLLVEAKQEPRDLTKLGYAGDPILIPHHDSMLVGSGIIDVVISPTSIGGYQGIFSKDGYGFVTGGHLLVEMVHGQLRVRLQSTRKSHRLDSGDFRVPVGVDTRVRVAFGPSGMRLLVGGALKDTNDYGGGLGATSGGLGNHQIAVLGGNNNSSRDGGLTPVRGLFRGTISDVVVSFFGSEPEPEPTFAVVVNGGEAEPAGPNLPGAAVTLVAQEPAPNHRFARWTVEGAAPKDAQSPTTTFAMPANAVTATAVFEKLPTFTVSVTHGTATPPGPNAAGVKVTLAAQAPAAGMRFTNWTMTNGVEFGDATSARTFFIMPAFNVAASANYEVIPTFALAIVGGVANPAGPNSEGAVVNIIANVPPPGQAFARWQVSDGVELADPRSPQTSFRMPETAVRIAAQFQNNTPSDLAYTLADGPVLVEHDDAVMLQDSGFIDLIVNPENTNGTQTVFAKDGNGFITGGHINLEMQQGKLVVRLQSATRSFRVDSRDFRVPTNRDTRVRVDFGAPTGLVLTVNDDELDTDDYVGGLGTSSGGIGNQQAFVLGANNNTSRNGGFTPLKEIFKGAIQVIDANFLDLGPRFLLTVVNGAGDGTYSAGRTIGIAADPAIPGEEFDAWTGDIATVADVNAPQTSIVTLDRAASVTATYKPLPAGFFTLTVNNGTGGGNFEQGTAHSITADAPAIGQRFDRWSSVPGATDAFASIVSATTSISMPSANTVVAPVYEAILYPLIVDNGTALVATLALNATTEVTAAAPPSGMVFVGWLSDTPGMPISTVMENPFAPSTTLTMPLDGVAVRATFALPSSGPTAMVLDTPADGSTVDHRGVTLMGRATDAQGIRSLLATVTPENGTPVFLNLSVGKDTGQWAVRLFDDDLFEGKPTRILLTATNGLDQQSTKEVSVMAGNGDKRLHKFVQRAMFGATPDLFASIRQAERNGTTDNLLNLLLDEQLSPDLADDPELIALGQPEQIQNGPQNLIQETSDLADIRLRRAIFTQWQLNEVMAIFWDNHFNTFASKDGNWVGELNEMNAFRNDALGSFRELLRISTHSPVMMVYLDNAASDGSIGSAPNQNYGREFLELHTLKANAGYDQDDVETMSALFAGWTVNEFDVFSDFVFDPSLHDPSDKPFAFLETTIGGRDGAAGIDEAEEAIDLIARHPATAKFICEKLHRVFVDDVPAPGDVSSCADVFLDSDGNIATVVRHILTAPAFADNAQHNGKVKSPLEYAASLARNFDADVDLTELNAMVADGGMPQFRQPIPTGWHEDARDWGTGSAMSALWELALEVAKMDAQTSIDIGGLVAEQRLETPEAIAAYVLGLVSGDQFSAAEFDVLVEELNFFGPYVDANAQRAVDALVRALSMALVSPAAIQN